MPRKKVVKGGLLGLETTQALVGALAETPPGLFALFAETPDQVRRFNREKHFFKCVAAMMEADNLNEPDPDYSRMDKDRRREIEDYKWRFVAFLRMVRSNWTVVQKALSTMNIRVLPPLESMNDPFLSSNISLVPPENLAEQGPESLAVEVIRLAAIGRLQHVFRRTNKWMEVTPRRIGRDIDTVRKGRDSNATPIQIQNSAEVYDFWIDNNPWFDLERQCRDAVARSRPKGERAIDFESYIRACRSHEAFAKRRMRNEKDSHPFREVWEGGLAMPYLHSQNGR